MALRGVCVEVCECGFIADQGTEGLWVELCDVVSLQSIHPVGVADGP